MNIRKMTIDDKETVLEMEKSLNSSDAVEEAAPIEVIERSFRDAVENEENLNGYIFEEDKKIVGFSYTTTFYSSEVGRKVIWIEELFVKDEYRGKGYGKAFLNYLDKKYPEEVRFRLEVTKDNRAISLYKRCGYTVLPHLQMVKDV